MTSKLKVNILADGGDNAIMTSNGSGTLTLNNAALKNTPVLSVGLSSTQTISDNTWTTIIMNTEILDADGIYNNSTGVATPTAGTYFMIFSANIGGNTNNTLQNAGVKFLVGSTTTAEQTVNPADSKSRYVSITTSYVQTFDGSTTVACQAYNDVSSGTPNVFGGSSPRFGATFQMIRLTGV
tara:strand:+ start:493 stop:1038 length:546 start_codon:yes stop_codon:yes gene_type:complete